MRERGEETHIDGTRKCPRPSSRQENLTTCQIGVTLVLRHIGGKRLIGEIWQRFSGCIKFIASEQALANESFLEALIQANALEHGCVVFLSSHTARHYDGTFRVRQGAPDADDGGKSPTRYWRLTPRDHCARHDST